VTNFQDKEFMYMLYQGSKYFSLHLWSIRLWEWRGIWSSHLTLDMHSKAKPSRMWK